MANGLENKRFLAVGEITNYQMAGFDTIEAAELFIEMFNQYSNNIQDKLVLKVFKPSNEPIPIGKMDFCRSVTMFTKFYVCRYCQSEEITEQHHYCPTCGSELEWIGE